MVDGATGKVFGHVVALDVFREAYVVPMEATLRAIRRTLQVRDVSLPTGFQVTETVYPPILLKSDFVDSGYSTMNSSQQ